MTEAPDEPEPTQAFEQSERLLLEPALLLRRTETAIVRAAVAEPGVLAPAELNRLRYLASFARLGVFEPGAAGPGGTRGRGDIDVSKDLASFSHRVVADLADPVRRHREPRERLLRAKTSLAQLSEPMLETRRTLLERHGSSFSEAELDAEVGNRELALVLGGGAGAGHVYLGALGLLVEHGLLPSYVLGTSIGSLYGGIFTHMLPVDIAKMTSFANGLTMGQVLSAPRRTRRHGLPGMFALSIADALASMLSDGAGRHMRLNETAIPFEAVVAGVRPRAFANLPSKMRHAELARIMGLAGAATRRGAAVAARMWQVGAFFDSRVVKPIVFGGDPLTAQMRVVDAIGFSCAVPGVLHYESDDPDEHGRLDQLMADKDVRAFVDGGTASNVAVELAWRRVQDGRLGTRNAVYLAFDCFHPQWDPRHLWLTPITQAVQVQMVRNAPFADWIRRFSPTLGVLDLVPGPEKFARAAQWGRASMEQDLGLIKALLAPTPWNASALARN